MRLKNRKFETFNDGILTVCEVSGRAIKRTKFENVRFGNKTVGAKRFWDAKVLDTVISRMVSVLRLPGIEREDVVIIEGCQYRIAQVQEKFDASPPCLYLSLESVQMPYRDEREGSFGEKD